MKSREALQQESKAYLDDLDSQINDIKISAERTLKYALIVGGGTLAAYVIFNAIFGGNNEGEEAEGTKKKVKKKKFKASSKISSGANMLTGELKNQAALVVLKLAADQLRKFLQESDNNGEK
ncbi:hypothetical protein [Roseivirga pacifica]|uniref:hypothetical protein n=1 Tax=Roseivirga pacifica TaxID=1267423 RepID=UPI002094569D|nr:hypothetical protein [Roseivirga pacifica]MCO6359701.1 hypothetical protein [Roseivirga pacifica]MCO6367071.1 hypothetical protein [Roseivirga pacifica]MCO6370397.1 hypothetical protein [Roseivirga pacifica]MCO6374728.1 hypothetical protein [Roseivirga pacifica]MCO6379986.1 hypothetical protein [Roseivirga pacifica]